MKRNYFVQAYSKVTFDLKGEPVKVYWCGPNIGWNVHKSRCRFFTSKSRCERVMLHQAPKESVTDVEMITESL